jgi:hypothetical protein
MDMQEIDDAHIAQVALDDPHHGWLLPTTLRGLSACIAARADDRQCKAIIRNLTQRRNERKAELEFRC